MKQKKASEYAASELLIRFYYSHAQLNLESGSLVIRLIRILDFMGWGRRLGRRYGGNRSGKRVVFI